MSSVFIYNLDILWLILCELAISYSASPSAYWQARSGFFNPAPDRSPAGGGYNDFISDITLDGTDQISNFVERDYASDEDALAGAKQIPDPGAFAAVWQRARCPGKVRAAGHSGADLLIVR
jgi:hypothetical protein